MARASKATLLRKLSDPYVKAIRYATDRIGESGVICFVNNNSFITERTFDAMRRELVKDFDLIYVLDLGGNVRKNPKLSGTTHNVFGIQVGVSINSFVRLPKPEGAKREARIYYHAVGEDWRRQQKYEFLREHGSVAELGWTKLTPDSRSNWITNNTDEEFESFIPIGSKEARAAGGTHLSIFHTYSLGVSSNRDDVVYDFDDNRLTKRVQQFIEDYNSELLRWQKKGRPEDVDDFVSYLKVKWSRDLKLKLARGLEIEYDSKALRDVLYRPFSKRRLYADHSITDRPGNIGETFPTAKSHIENRMICVSDAGLRSPFSCLMTNCMPDLHLCASTDGFQCFSLYTYSPEGKRHDNITIEALNCFRHFYDDTKISREHVFYYVYALMHHFAYRHRYAENFKRDLPHIPFVCVLAGAEADAPASFSPASEVDRLLTGGDAKHDPDKSAELFHAMAASGRKLAGLHVDYESAKEFKLKRQENKGVKLDWRVEAMKLSKDKETLFYNDFLTLHGIPFEAFRYRLGNRSALEWVIDQYRVGRDDNGEIVTDPNRIEDEEFILRLIAKVITVSVESAKIIENLPPIDES